MPGFIATLHSAISDRAALALFDTRTGLTCLQIEPLPPWVKTSQLRGIGCLKDTVYVATPAGILTYELTMRPGQPVFRQSGHLKLREWVLGTKTQADLLGLLVSTRRQTILIANNHLNCVDELSCEGDLVRRHFLFDIAPDLFPFPEHVVETHSYGRIVGIFENKQTGIWLTVNAINNTGTGCVLNFESGEILLDNLSSPHGGILTKNYFLIQNMTQGLLSAHAMAPDGKITPTPTWSSPVGDETENRLLQTRGMVVIDDQVFCGAFTFGQAHDTPMPPSRIVRFALQSGSRLAPDIILPDLDEFRMPRVFFLAPLPRGYQPARTDRLSFFKDGLSIPPREFKEIPGEEKDELIDNRSSGTEAPPVRHQPETENKVSPPLATRGQEAVRLQGVSLYYTRNTISLFTFNKQARNRRSFQALADISFCLHEGETLGIIGRNGSGKSTISMVISGALVPDEGTVATRGRVQLLSIGLGFRNELTGRENVYINGALLGLNKKEIRERLPDIEDFAELGSFIDEPVRTYSAGMRSRLGFAVATAVSPDILILDEVMSTGDAAFREKAKKRMNSMRERTRTIIVISHSIGQIKHMCSRVIWLHQGRLLMDGKPDVVAAEYDSFCKNPDAWIKANQEHFSLERTR